MTSTDRTILVAAVLAVSLVGACGPNDGSGTGGTDAGNGADTTVTDETPPEFRKVQLAVKGEFSSQVNLSNEDVTRVLPVPAEARVTIFATDIETASENLEVGMVDSEGSELSKKSTEFRNGLWRFTVEIGPGMELRARVADRAGNAATSEYKLTIPSRARALRGNWEQRLYTNEDEPSVRTRHDLAMKDDGTWKMSRDMFDRGGKFRVENDRLVWQRTYQTGGSNADSDRKTVELDRASTYYVDEEFFAPQPWKRDGSSSGMAGTWTRESTLYEHGNGRTEAATVRERLELNEKSGADNTFSYTNERTPSGSGNASKTTASGTWKTIELTSNYGESFGTFLVRKTTHRDGSKLQKAEIRTELYRLPLDLLLVSPYIRK